MTTIDCDPFVERVNQAKDSSELMSIIDNLPSILGCEDTIYHYTKPEYFMNMIPEEKKPDNKKCFRLHLSRIDCLNDASEGREASDLFYSILRRVEYDKEFPKEFVDGVRSYCIEQKRDIFENVCGPSDYFYYETYIACFSRDENSLAMWNYYSKNGLYEGCSVGLRTECFKKDGNHLFGNVIYAKKENRGALSKMTRSLLSKCFVLNAAKKYSDNNFSAFYIMYRFFLILRPFIKNSHFQHENETRMIIRRAIKTKGDYADPRSCIEYPKKYKISHGFMIPYIEYETEDKTILQSVKLGPAPHWEKEKSEEIITGFLHDRGFSGEDVKITSSDIPVRH